MRLCLTYSVRISVSRIRQRHNGQEFPDIVSRITLMDIPSFLTDSATLFLYFHPVQAAWLPVRFTREKNYFLYVANTRYWTSSGSSSGYYAETNRRLSQVRRTMVERRKYLLYIPDSPHVLSVLPVIQIAEQVERRLKGRDSSDISYSTVPGFMAV